MHDDIENDWLAQELREEGYHGCMSHRGQHATSRSHAEELGGTSLKDFLNRAVEENRRNRERNHMDRPTADVHSPKKQATVIQTIMLLIVLIVLLSVVQLILHF